MVPEGVKLLQGETLTRAQELEHVSHKLRLVHRLALGYCGCECHSECSYLVVLPQFREEVWASLEGDENLGLLAVALVVLNINCDGLGSDILECSVVVPDEVLSRNDANGDSVAEGVQFNSLVSLKLYPCKEDIKVGVFPD